MSHNYRAKVIFGFPLDTYPSKELLGNDESGIENTLHEWLDEKGICLIEQVNAGNSSGGTPCFFVGKAIYEVDDFTRATPFTFLSDITVSDLTCVDARKAAGLLGVSPDRIGFYLIGERG